MNVLCEEGYRTGNRETSCNLDECIQSMQSKVYRSWNSFVRKMNLMELDVCLPRCPSVNVSLAVVGSH